MQMSALSSTSEELATETSNDEQTAEAKSMELKDNGNRDLLAGRILLAIEAYSEAIECCPKPNAIILSNRAQAYIKVENYGLAITDATDAIEADPTYAKAYYRRGTCEFVLNKNKAARKDFRMVCKLKPKDRDARAKFTACDKLVKEAEFLAAIVSLETAPLSDTLDPDPILVDGYKGPHPNGGSDALGEKESEQEDALFSPGNMPMSFVMVSLFLSSAL